MLFPSLTSARSLLARDRHCGNIFGRGLSAMIAMLLIRCPKLICTVSDRSLTLGSLYWSSIEYTELGSLT